LFIEYQSSLNLDLGFQGFAEECAGLPGDYIPPRGRLMLAVTSGQVVGCVALRPIDRQRCEMKRLFIRPLYRGKGYGRILARRIISEAWSIGYRYLLLDTLHSMTAAQTLYESLGFKESPAYYTNPLPDVRYMILDLREISLPREMRHDEIGQVGSLIRSTIQTCYSGVYPRRAVDFFLKYHSDEAIEERAQRGVILVTELFGELAATGSLVENAIAGVFVKRVLQGKGFGRAIMDELERRAALAGFREATLSVSLPSRPFYEKRGYVLISSRIDVGQGQELIYWKGQKDISVLKIAPTDFNP
jgi:GNAT superfamily N-acetyltransferase